MAAGAAMAATARTPLTFMLMASVGIAACDRDTTNASQAHAQDARGSDAATIESFVERSFAELGLVPGMAVAVVRDTSVVLLRGFGVADVSSRTPVTADTPFYIASSTKSFTGTAAAMLEQRGVWELDDPLSRWLPDVRLPASLSPDSITLRHLLTHTSRIDNDPIVFRTAYSGEHDAATLIELLAQSGVRDPGFSYGNIGYVVTSLAMDAATGTGWKDILQREIFDPLGMHRTSAYRSAFDSIGIALPHGASLGYQPFEIRPYIKVDANMHAAGGIITTAADLARWLLANLNGGRIGDRQLLPAAVIGEAHRRQASTQARFFDFARTGYGLGWYHADYEGDLVLHHFGNYPGFRGHVSFMPEHRIGVAVLTNESAQGYFVPEMIATGVYDRLLNKPRLTEKYDSLHNWLLADAARVRASIARDVARRAARPDSMAFPLDTYTGTFISPLGGTLVIDKRFGRLHATIGALASFMDPIDDRTLMRVELIPGSGEEIRFFPGSRGADSLSYADMIFRRR